MLLLCCKSIELRVGAIFPQYFSVAVKRSTSRTYYSKSIKRFYNFCSDKQLSLGAAILLLTKAFFDVRLIKVVRRLFHYYTSTNSISIQGIILFLPCLFLSYS